MLDLSTLTHERLAALLGQSFAIDQGAAGVLQAQLVEVTPWGNPLPGGPRQAFSAIFRGPGAPLLPQGIYALDQAGLGRLAIFLVPVGRDGDGVLYEANFN